MVRIFNFLNILDSEGKLSITNLAVYIVLIKLTISPVASLTEAGSLLMVLANYAHKRIVNTANAQPDETPDMITPQIDAMKTKMSDVESKISALSLQAGIKKLN